MRVLLSGLLVLLITGCNVRSSNTEMADSPRSSEGASQHQETTPDQALAALKKGDFDRAILLADRLIKQSPQPVLYALRGSAYARKKNYEQAIADCSEAIRLDP